MRYDEELKVIAKSDKTILDRGDMVIKDMCKLTEDILNYRYACERYQGDDNSVLIDKMNTIKNSMAVLTSELEIYMQSANIKYDVNKKSAKRIHKIAGKLTRI